MKIKFIGAVGGDTTGSCTLCEHNGTQFLVDCGTFKEDHRGRERINVKFPFDPKSIDFVLLTHAHHDHCGRIPNLIEGGFAGKIYCTEATRDLAILSMVGDNKELKDLMHMMSYMLPHEKSGQKGVQQWLKRGEYLLYRRENIEKEQKCLREQADALCRGISDDRQKHKNIKMRREHLRGERKNIGEKEEMLRGKLRKRLGKLWKKWFVTDMLECSDLKVAMLRSSHILGAVSFVVAWDCEKAICFSGDLGSAIGGGDNHLPFLKEGDFLWEKIDYVVMESTRGGQKPEEGVACFDKRIDLLQKWVQSSDTIVFACSAIQGAQNVLFDLAYVALRGEGQPFEIILDSKKTIAAQSLGT